MHTCVRACSGVGQALFQPALGGRHVIPAPCMQCSRCRPLLVLFVTRSVCEAVPARTAVAARGPWAFPAQAAAAACGACTAPVQVWAPAAAAPRATAQLPSLVRFRRRIISQCLRCTERSRRRHRHADSLQRKRHGYKSIQECCRLRSRLRGHLHNDHVTARQVNATCANSIHKADQTFHPRSQGAASRRALFETCECSRMRHVLHYLGPSSVCPIRAWPPKIKFAEHTTAFG